MVEREDVKAGITQRLCDALEAAMKNEGVPSLIQLSEALQRKGYRVRPTDFTRWKNGEIPDLNRVPELAEALGISWPWLLTGRGKREPMSGRWPTDS